MASISEQMAIAEAAISRVREAQAREQLLRELWRCVRQIEEWCEAMKNALSAYNANTGSEE